MDVFQIHHFSFTNTFWHQTNKPSIQDVDLDSLNCVHKYNKVIALGNFSSMILTHMGVKHFKMPHPSPRNRIFNDKNKENELLTKCKHYIYEL